jgi:flagellum-specific peptidoglycan hydrolase FlgJ
MKNRGSLTRYIIAQSKHETANFTSDVFKRANNAFGMKNPHIRNSVGFVVEGDSYRHYSSFAESVKDLLLWMEFTNFPQRVDGVFDYVSALNQRGYFEDSLENYLEGVKRWL